MRRLAPLAVLAALVLLCAGSAQAVPGNLDPSFGVGGKVMAPVGSGDFGEALAIQPDGKIVVAGWGWDDGFVVARYLPDGLLDASFGQGGKTTTSFGPNRAAQARAIALQSNGKIVVAGAVGNDTSFALARYNADGSIDSTFGSGGTVKVSVGGVSGAYAVAVQPDGRIVVAGRGAADEFGLARLNPDGSLDSGFGTGGTVTTTIGSLGIVYAIALQPDGRIVAGGFPGFTLARYDPNGSLDATFGTQGIATTASGAEEGARALALQSDGKIVVAGDDHERGFTLARYTPSGALDPTFGSGGVASTALGWFSRARGVAVQPDGRISAAGEATVGAIQAFAVARYDADGTPDAGFGDDGVVVSDLSTYPTIVYGSAASVALQSDGKIVVGGTAQVLTGGGNPTFGLARYLVTPGCRVPDVRDRRLEAAKAAIVGAGCSVGRVKRAFSRSIKRGRVISQLPHPGAGRPDGAPVKLVVSKGRRSR